jgi:hypothetical protein
LFNEESTSSLNSGKVRYNSVYNPAPSVLNSNKAKSTKHTQLKFWLFFSTGVNLGLTTTQRKGVGEQEAEGHTFGPKSEKVTPG